MFYLWQKKLFRIIKYLRLEKTFNMESNHWPGTAVFTTVPGPQVPCLHAFWTLPEVVLLTES